MGIFHLTTKVVQRSKGHSAVAAAAYRARMEITNERTGETWDYSRKSADVLFQGIYTPQGAPAWMQDRAQLWNSVEKSETRKDAQVARDFIIALPHELELKQQRYALQDWVKENFTRKGFVADVAIHQPGREGDERNVHAHVLVTMRTVAGAEWNAHKERTAGRLADLDQWRDSWEKIGNRHLLRHGHEATLDKRTLAAQGIDRVPTIHLGKDALEMERAGKETSRGDLLREIQAENLARDLERQFQHKVTVLELHKVAASIEESESGSRSAIDRQRDEEREQDRRQGFRRNEAQRSVMAAIWSLARTAGATLSNIVLGANRADLMQGRTVEAVGRERHQSAEQIAAAREREAFAAELRGEVPKQPEQTRQVKQAPATRPNERMAARDHVPWDSFELRAMEKMAQANAQEIAGRRAADLVEKYNSPANAAEAENTIPAEPAAWAPARQDLGRVQGLIDALGVTPPNPVQKRESYLDRLERQQAEKGQTLADLTPQEDRDRQKKLEQERGNDLGLGF